MCPADFVKPSIIKATRFFFSLGASTSIHTDSKSLVTSITETHPCHPSSGCRMLRYCHLLLSSRTVPHSGVLRSRDRNHEHHDNIYMQGGSGKCHLNSRMLALSLDMAATASSCVANSTSASPVTLPSGPISIWTRTGFNGEKN